MGPRALPIFSTSSCTASCDVDGAATSLIPLLPDGLIDYYVQGAWEGTVGTPFWRIGDVLGISFKDSGVRLAMAGLRGGGWHSFVRGERLLHFVKVKIPEINLLSEQYLASHSGSHRLLASHGPRSLLLFIAGGASTYRSCTLTRSFLGVDTQLFSWCVCCRPGLLG